MARLDRAQAAVRDLALFWPSQRDGHEGFVDFEAKQIEELRAVACASAELALAEAKDRRERDIRFQVGNTAFRMSGAEPRSLKTWFGTVRYAVPPLSDRCPPSDERGLGTEQRL